MVLGSWYWAHGRAHGTGLMVLGVMVLGSWYWAHGTGRHGRAHGTGLMVLGVMVGLMVLGYPHDLGAVGSALWCASC
jgi:hypothetical protein